MRKASEAGLLKLEKRSLLGGSIGRITLIVISLFKIRCGGQSVNRGACCAIPHRTRTRDQTLTFVEIQGR